MRRGQPRQNALTMVEGRAILIISNSQNVSVIKAIQRE
jgi:hypothetical protein